MAQNARVGARSREELDHFICSQVEPEDLNSQREDVVKAEELAADRPEEYFSPRKPRPRYDVQDAVSATTFQEFPAFWNGSQAQHFLSDITNRTGTRVVTKPVIRGLKHCIDAFLSIQLFIEIGDKQRITIGVKGFILYIWLAVCYKAHNNGIPTRENPVWHMCAVLRRAAVLIAVSGSSNADAEEADLEDLLRYWYLRVEQTCYTAGRNTGRPWSRSSWWMDIQHAENLFLDTNDTHAESYLRHLRKKRIWRLVDQLLKEELDSGRDTKSPMVAALKTWPAEIKLACWEVIASMEPRFLEACIQGTLTSYTLSGWDHPVKKEFDVLQARGNKAPGIYANFFTDRAGVALTPAQMAVVAAAMWRYCTSAPTADDNNWAVGVDCHFERWSWDAEFTRKGYRRYFDARNTADEKGSFLPARRSTRPRAQTQIFLKELRRRIEKLKGKGFQHRPSLRPLVEIGYAKEPMQRIEDHAEHVGSNYIMSLFHVLMLQNFGQDFQLTQHVIYSCWGPNQAWASEVLLTDLLQGYTKNGTGMSHYQAGLSNASSFQKAGDAAWFFVMTDGDVMQRTERALREEKAANDHLRQQSAALASQPMWAKGWRGQTLEELANVATESGPGPRSGLPNLRTTDALRTLFEKTVQKES